MVTGLPQGTVGRVLVMVKQPAVAELIELTLNHGVFITRRARDAAEATRLLSEWAPHLAVIEAGIADGPLLQLLGKPGARQPTSIPVLGLTHRGDLKTKLAAFDQGMDDIMTVPFSPEELLARVLALTRRVYEQPISFTPVLKVGELEINILNRQVRVGEKVLHLTGLEQSLLYLLAANAGRLLTRDEIIDAVWGVDFVPDSNIVDRHVRNLRAKLESGKPRSQFISTVSGQGYRFMPMVPISGPDPS